MDKPLMVLPNFLVLAETFNEQYSHVKETHKSFATLQESMEHTHTYIISASSIWKGLQDSPNEDILGILEQFSKQKLPDNVVFEIKSWISRFGVIRLIDDCLFIRDGKVLNEIVNHPMIKSHIHSIEDNLVGIADNHFLEVKSIIEQEIGYPIKVNEVKSASYLFEFINKDTKREYCCVVRGENELEAFIKLYGFHPGCNSADLAQRLKSNKPTSVDDIREYMKIKYSEKNSDPKIKFCVRVLPKTTLLSPKLIFGRY